MTANKLMATDTGVVQDFYKKKAQEYLDLSTDAARNDDMVLAAEYLAKHEEYDKLVEK